MNYLIKEAKESLTILEQTNIEEEKGKEWSLELIYLFQDLKFFPSQSFKETVPKKMGLMRNSKKWFIKLNKIIDEIEKINKIDGVYLSPYIALYHIDSHLNFKIMNDLLIDFNMASTKKKGGGSTFYNNIYLRFFKVQRSRKYFKDKSNEFKGTKEDTIINDLITYLENKNDSTFQNIDIIMEIRGKTEKTILNNLFNHILFSPIKPILKKERYSIVFDLFKLILPERTFYTIKEFEKAYSKNNPFNNDYDRYKAHTIKKILIS